MNTQPSESYIEKYGDIISQLPSDNALPTHNEMVIVDKLFQEKKSIIMKILNGSKEFLILAGLFIVFSLPFVHNTLSSFIPIMDRSQYIGIIIKASIFVVIYFIIKNSYLAKKKE